MATIKELKASNAPRFKVPGKEAIYDAFDQFLAENFLGETVEAIPAAPTNGKQPHFTKLRTRPKATPASGKQARVPRPKTGI